MKFFKKKYRLIKDYPDIWLVTQATREERPIFLRYRDGLKEAIGHPEYPFQIGIAIPLLSPTEHGLTSHSEGELLSKIEDELDKQLCENNNAVEALVITHAGMREFVYYASKWEPEELEKQAKSVESFGHEIQFMMQHDPKWETYTRFVPK
jgi:hypothetical protein